MRSALRESSSATALWLAQPPRATPTSARCGCSRGRACCGPCPMSPERSWQLMRRLGSTGGGLDRGRCARPCSGPSASSPSPSAGRSSSSSSTRARADGATARRRHAGDDAARADRRRASGRVFDRELAPRAIDLVAVAHRRRRAARPEGPGMGAARRGTRSRPTAVETFLREQTGDRAAPRRTVIAPGSSARRSGASRRSICDRAAAPAP